MQASDKELELLEQLQKVDRDRVSAQKKFDELPHRKAILDVRKKKAEVQGKRDQVQGLLDATEKNLHNLMHEDAMQIYTVHPTGLWAMNKKVKGFVDNPVYMGIYFYPMYKE